jgi:hypothetical protein
MRESKWMMISYAAMEMFVVYRQICTDIYSFVRVYTYIFFTCVVCVFVFSLINLKYEFQNMVSMETILESLKRRNMHQLILVAMGKRGARCL